MSSPPPAAGHTHDFEELAGLAALGVLEGDELASFEQHAQTCERCRAIERADRAAVMERGGAAPEMDPSPGFKERLFERARAELVQQEPVRLEERRVVPLHARRPAWLASLAAVFVIALAGAGTYSYMNQVVTSVTLTGSASGEAVVLVRRSGAATLQMRGLPNPQPGSVYEAWIIPPNQAPVPAGITSAGQADLPLSGSLNGSTVAITVEQAPGATAPTTPPILAAPVVS
jgi:anti-sigma-K factor RskA